MEDNDLKESVPPKKSGDMWKLWLAVAILVAWSVLANMEASSPKAHARRDQDFRNAVGAVYSETYASCEAGTSETECREQARDAAQMAKEKLGPALGR